MKNKKIGFIGQGWIGKHYADDFEKRGYNVVRYALEEPYINNGDAIKKCDIVFIAVPTPTTQDGFDDSILRKVIKTKKKKKENPDIFVMHSPEFLKEATAEYDAANPSRNIIGIIKHTDNLKKKAEEVLSVLPNAPYNKICGAKEAEIIKYGGNCFLYFKIIFANLLYDLSKKLEVEYDVVKEAISADPRIGKSHLSPVHKSGGGESGRGAGGHCFIKDFEAFTKMYKELINNDKHGYNVLDSLQKKNIKLLINSNKDLDLLKGVFGDKIKLN